MRLKVGRKKWIKKWDTVFFLLILTVVGGASTHAAGDGPINELKYDGTRPGSHPHFSGNPSLDPGQAQANAAYVAAAREANQQRAAQEAQLNQMNEKLAQGLGGARQQASSLQDAQIQLQAMFAELRAEAAYARNMPFVPVHREPTGPVPIPQDALPAEDLNEMIAPLSQPDMTPLQKADVILQIQQRVASLNFERPERSRRSATSNALYNSADFLEQTLQRNGVTSGGLLKNLPHVSTPSRLLFSKRDSENGIQIRKGLNETMAATSMLLSQEVANRPELAQSRSQLKSWSDDLMAGYIYAESLAASPNWVDSYRRAMELLAQARGQLRDFAEANVTDPEEFANRVTVLLNYQSAIENGVAIALSNIYQTSDQIKNYALANHDRYFHGTPDERRQLIGELSGQVFSGHFKVAPEAPVGGTLQNAIEHAFLAQATLNEVNPLSQHARQELNSPHVTAQFEQNATQYIRDQLDQAEASAQAMPTLVHEGVTLGAQQLIADYAAQTVGAIGRLFEGFNAGMYHGMVSLAQTLQAIGNDPQLVLHLSTDIMNTLTDGPGAIGAALWRGTQAASNALNHFLLTMAVGTNEDRGFALGELGGNLIAALATEGASQVAAASLTAIAGSMARNEGLGTAIHQAMRGSEAFAPQMAAADATVAGIVESARRHGIEIVTGPLATTVDRVIIETLEGKGNVTSKLKLTADEALDAGKKWVGEGYRERKAGSGVFVSADGQRQFRMDNNSLLGKHAPDVPHVHLETLAPGQKVPVANNHIPFQD